MNMQDFDTVFVVAHVRGLGYLPIGFQRGQEVYRGEYQADAQAAFDRCVAENYTGREAL